MEKIDHLPNGQWALSKSNQLFNDEGETHEVEVHPDIDQLYRAKDLIKRSGRPHLHIQDIKHTGAFNNLINKIPRDATGKVTAKMIDDHIEKLPKQKVIIKTAPYKWRAQLHDDGAEEHVASVQLHPDTLSKLDPKTALAWQGISDSQHKLIGRDVSSQIGWARIDHGKRDHWHVDEIQSDFKNKKKINKAIDDAKYIIHNEEKLKFQDEVLQQGDSHPLRELQRRAGDIIIDGEYTIDGKDLPNTPELQRWKQIIHDTATDRIKNMGDMQLETDSVHNLLSHGHEDPQHLIHSAINALARKKNIGSMSMDTPEDQARSSGLDDGTGRGWRENVRRYNEMNEIHPDMWQQELNWINNGQHPSLENPYFKSGLDKIGLDTLSDLVKYHTLGAGDNINDMMNKLNSLPEPERDAIHDVIVNYSNRLHEQVNGPQTAPKISLDKLPVHFLNTYHKRPKQLGYKSLPKGSILGSSEYPGQQVQYSPVFKTIQLLKDKLKKIKGAK